MKYISFLLIVLSLPACGTLPTNSTSSQNPPVEKAMLSDVDIGNLKAAGHKGDILSCYKLYIYYAFTVRDDGKFRYWLRKAAELGYPMAEYNLAVCLSTSDNEADKSEAKLWYEKAAKHGIYKP